MQNTTMKQMAAFYAIGLVIIMSIAVSVFAQDKAVEALPEVSVDRARATLREAGFTWNPQGRLVICGGEPMLALFGPEFTAGYPLLFLLVCGVVMFGAMLGRIQDRRNAVLRLTQDEVRHHYLPLRVSPAQVSATARWGEGLRRLTK